MHCACYNEWGRGKTETTCPICRVRWNFDTDEEDKVLVLNEELNWTYLDKYVHWLYSGDLDVAGLNVWGNTALNNDLTHYWRISEAMQDSTFRMEVATAFLSEFQNSKCAFSAKDIRRIWKTGTEADKGLKQFMLDVCRAGPSMFDSTAIDMNLPKSFLSDLSALLMGTMGQDKVTLEWLVEKYTDGTYEVVREASDDAAVPDAADSMDE
jgi:hypothetical protein